MKYKIDGGSLPVLKVFLETGEKIECEAGAMSWMDPGIKMETTAGGLGKMLGRVFTSESAFMNNYVAKSSGEIAFSAKFPGSIVAIEITPGNGLIVQKGSFLASAGNIQNEVYLRKKLSSGFFGGEGFLMRKFTGSGIIFLEIDGSSHEYQLASGESKIIDTGYVAYMSESCSMEILSVKGVSNVLFGGEGLFNTKVTGPGKVALQSMPAATTAAYIRTYLPSN